MRTLSQYAQIIEDNKQNPGALAELSDEIAADYARCAEQMTNVQLNKPHKFVEIKKSKMKEIEGGWEGKPLSDTLTEMIWRTGKIGKEEVRLKYRMKALEKCLSSIKSHIFVLNNEAHSSY